MSRGSAPRRRRPGAVDTAGAALLMILTVALTGCSSDGSSAVPATVTVTTTAGVDDRSVAGASDPSGDPSDAADAPDPSPAPTGPPPAVAGSEIVATYGELGPTTAVPPNSGGAGTAGSGCRPGSSATLPDGVWMARLVSITVEGPAAAALDLVCFSTVRSLAAAGSTRAVEDFAVDNDNPLARDVPVAVDVSYYLQQPPPPTVAGREAQRVAFSSEQRGELQAWLARNGAVLAWVQVRGGVVTEVYAPPLTTA